MYDDTNCCSKQLLITSHAKAKARGSSPGATKEHLRMMAGARSARLRSTSTAAARVQNSSCGAEPTASIASVTGAWSSKADNERQNSLDKNEEEKQRAIRYIIDLDWVCSASPTGHRSLR